MGGWNTSIPSSHRSVTLINNASNDIKKRPQFHFRRASTVAVIVVFLTSLPFPLRRWLVRWKTRRTAVPRIYCRGDDEALPELQPTTSLDWRDKSSMTSSSMSKRRNLGSPGNGVFSWLNLLIFTNFLWWEFAVNVINFVEFDWRQNWEKLTENFRQKAVHEHIRRLCHACVTHGSLYLCESNIASKKQLHVRMSRL